jgi:hypothetical protein
MSSAWPGQPPELQMQLAVVRAVSDTLESSVANDTSGASASLMDQLAEPSFRSVALQRFSGTFR